MQQSNGLRFDVYERVHLPVDAADVHELEEIELTPYIQVVNQGEQVLLRGNLLLGGVYVSQGETRTTQTLEHWIPVEITLPANRVSNVEALNVEVDNFDVDLLSARTLNIIGVLSLKGVEARESAAPAYTWGEEPFTVVHQRERVESAEDRKDEGAELPLEAVRASEPNEPVDDQDAAEAPASVPSEAERAPLRQGELPASAALSGAADGYGASAPLAESEQDASVSSSEPVKWSGFAVFANETRDEGLRERTDSGEEASTASSSAARLTDLEEPAESAPAAADAREQAEADAALAQEPQAAADTDVPAEAADAADEPAAVAVDGQPAEEEAPAKPELKVAVTAKRLPEAPSKAEAQGLSKLLFTNRTEPETRWNPDAKAAKQPLEPEAEERPAPPADEVEWKKLFLGHSPEEQFRKVRMCIVQKDETLDSIAGRYQLNPREIVLYNRLADQAVSEGQVLMIP